MAFAEGPRHPEGGGDDRRGEGIGPGDLRHAGHAQWRAGACAEGCRPGLLQPQPRYRAGLLRFDHPHAPVPGPPRYAGARARRRPENLLRRHRRHGRDARAAGRPAAGAGHAAGPSRFGADQQAGAGGGYPAARQCRAGPVRVRAHDRRGAHRHAALDGAAVGRA
ncbi:hypothetical protein G6F23_013944 [Rhizopus arrhizus]|nr:hypothetical protein G6F23_013944 [Rhizopus arrhizus]